MSVPEYKHTLDEIRPYQEKLARIVKERGWNRYEAAEQTQQIPCRVEYFCLGIRIEPEHEARLIEWLDAYEDQQ